MMTPPASCAASHVRVRQAAFEMSAPRAALDTTSAGTCTGSMTRSGCRDLMAARAGYREALVALGGLASLVALLDAPEKPVTLYVAQALGHIASTPSCRAALR